MICEKKEKIIYLSIYKGVRGVGENEIQDHSALCNYACLWIRKPWFVAWKYGVRWRVVVLVADHQPMRSFHKNSWVSHWKWYQYNYIVYTSSYMSYFLIFIRLDVQNSVHQIKIKHVQNFCWANGSITRTVHNMRKIAI
jgi:hypothetical protein